MIYETEINTIKTILREMGKELTTIDERLNKLELE